MCVCVCVCVFWCLRACWKALGLEEKEGSFRRKLSGGVCVCVCVWVGGCVGVVRALDSSSGWVRLEQEEQREVSCVYVCVWVGGCG